MIIISFLQDHGSVPLLERLLIREGSYEVLCKFFEQKWKKNITYQEKLQHCLNWLPMKSFLHHFCKFPYSILSLPNSNLNGI